MEENNKIELKLFYFGDMEEETVVSIVMDALRKSDADCNVLMSPLNQQSSTPQSVDKEANEQKDIALTNLDWQVASLIKERDELKAWKESMLSVMPPMQEIGKAIGVKLGESIHDKILPAINDQQKQIEELRKENDELKKLVKEENIFRTKNNPTGNHK